MPTYEYECGQCGHRFEAFQSMRDAPLTECPRCGGGVKRLFGTGAGFLFRGSGFYQTDYRSEAYKKRAREEAGGGDGGKGTDPGKEKGAETDRGKGRSGTTGPKPDPGGGSEP